jgi:hypothetical protein
MSLLDDSTRKRFIDRDPDATSFRHFLGNSACALMLLHGPSGVGKTWLLDRFVREAARGCWLTAVLVWRRTRHDSFLSLLKAYHDALGAQRLPQLSRAIEAQMQAGRGVAGANVQIAQGADLRDAQIGRIVGYEQHFVVHGDLHLDGPSSVGLEKDRLLLLTRAFCDDLVELSRREPIVLILDGHDEMPDNTADWLWEECIRLLDEERIWPRLKLILCGETAAKLRGGIRAANALVHEVVPLTRESRNIEQYLRARGFDEAQIPVLAKLAFSLCSGLNTADFCDKIDLFMQDITAGGAAVHG